MTQVKRAMAKQYRKFYTQTELPYLGLAALLDPFQASNLKDMGLDEDEIDSVMVKLGSMIVMPTEEVDESEELGQAGQQGRDKLRAFIRAKKQEATTSEATSTAEVPFA
jgi:hypothetical protein